MLITKFLLAAFHAPARFIERVWEGHLANVARGEAEADTLAQIGSECRAGEETCDYRDENECGRCFSNRQY